MAALSAADRALWAFLAYEVDSIGVPAGKSSGRFSRSLGLRGVDNTVSCRSRTSSVVIRSIYFLPSNGSMNNLTIEARSYSAFGDKTVGAILVMYVSRDRKSDV